MTKKKNPQPEEKRSHKAKGTVKKEIASPPQTATKDAKGRKRPASNPPPPAIVAPPPPPAYRPETSELERRRLEVMEDLRRVETQIYDLESKYLETSSAYGNAVRGYEGFLGGAGVANRKVVVKQEERLFSSSSATGQAVANAAH